MGYGLVGGTQRGPPSSLDALVRAIGEELRMGYRESGGEAGCGRGGYLCLSSLYCCREGGGQGNCRTVASFFAGGTEKIGMSAPIRSHCMAFPTL